MTVLEALAELQSFFFFFFFFMGPCRVFEMITGRFCYTKTFSGCRQSEHIYKFLRTLVFWSRICCLDSLFAFDLLLTIVRFGYAQWSFPLLEAFL